MKHLLNQAVPGCTLPLMLNDRAIFSVWQAYFAKVSAGSERQGKGGFEILRWLELGGALAYSFELHHLGGIIQWIQSYTEQDKREMG
ncbi:MAG: hypothetical protein H7833_05485 [Magnetococcus sp. DMHC-1]|nr:hypothetical protein [Magnetococcales bacterium]